MVENLLSNRYSRQIDTLEGPDHGFSSGVVSGAFEISGIQPGQFLVQISQVLTGTIFDRGQHPQSNREQPYQAGRTFVTLQIHRGQRHRPAFEPTKTSFNEILLRNSSGSIPTFLRVALCAAKLPQFPNFRTGSKRTEATKSPGQDFICHSQYNPEKRKVMLSTSCENLLRTLQ